MIFEAPKQTETMVASSFLRGIVGPIAIARDIQPITDSGGGGAMTMADDGVYTGVCTVCTVSIQLKVITGDFIFEMLVLSSWNFLSLGIVTRNKR